MSSDVGQTLADRVNSEPVIFKGCTSSELGVIVGVATLVWLPLSLLIAGLLGAITMGFGLAGIAIVATVLVAAAIFQRLKRNRPDGYYQQRFVIALHDAGIRRSVLVRRDGVWDIGRSWDGSLPLRDR